MAEVTNKEDVYLEILDNVIIAYHSDDIDPNILPEGHSTMFASVEEPATLLGLKPSDVDLPPKDRPILNTVPEVDRLYSQLRYISVDIDLTVRMGNDPKDLQTQFDTIKAQYDALLGGQVTN